MNFTWKDLAPIFKRIGLPVLAWLLEHVPAAAGDVVKSLPFGGFFAPGVEKAARGILNQVVKALGLDPSSATPEDVRTAIESGGTTEVLAKLQAVEAKAASITALVDLFKSDNETDVEMARINSETYLANRRAEAATNSPWQSMYRPLLMYGLTFALLYLIGIVLYALTVGGPVVDNLARMETIVVGMFGTLISVLVGHFVTRSSERKAFLAPDVPPAPAAVVVAQAPKAPAGKAAR